MRPPRGKFAALIVLAAALAILGAAAWTYRLALIEAWYLPRLTHQDDAVRQDAAQALARLGSPTAAARLFRLSLDAPISSTLEDAAVLAIRTRGPSGAFTFARELRPDPWTARIRIAERLIAFDVPREYLASLLSDALADESPAVRRWGAECLTRSPEASATLTARLRELLHDADEDVKLWAGLGLARVEPRSGVER